MERDQPTNFTSALILLLLLLLLLDKRQMDEEMRLLEVLFIVWQVSVHFWTICLTSAMYRFRPTPHINLTPFT